MKLCSCILQLGCLNHQVVITCVKAWRLQQVELSSHGYYQRLVRLRSFWVDLRSMLVLKLWIQKVSWGLWNYLQTPFYIGVTSANSLCHYAPIYWKSKGNVLFTWILCTGFYTCIATYICSWIYLTIGLVFFMIPLGPTWANHVSRHAGHTTLHKVGEMILVRRCAFFLGSRGTV